ncbi:hypothetical protein EI546_11065 [Aequorivita sp. H23M31]|uniref:Uncharacterized protein n=1 Tax=Aequorivita ciconiae TaxID=2494375 RepID=A0A410G4M9_9FLAO|nr:hypothetical protein [Aequorivita sp. H23M31]QAA82223.1 hypothetical protein EI546_11040 [Aequorivita sp. H23M31]QAA82228.1 hypothetical protein EI546_11065 [Aequorivita sp. H23M31]
MFLELNCGTEKKEVFGTFAIGQDFEKSHSTQGKFVKERKKSSGLLATDSEFVWRKISHQNR